MRVVVDTNVLVSGLLNPHGTCAEVLHKVHFPADTYRGIRIASPREFLDVTGTSDARV